MLPRSQRLSTEQFNHAMKIGRVYHSSLFLVRVVPVDEHTRVSATISSKIAKTAVLRNRIRRKIYEAVHLFMPTLAPGYHVAMIAKAPIFEATQKTIEISTKEVFVKAGLLR